VGTSLITMVSHMLIAVTLALGCVLLLRVPLRHVFGPKISYLFWAAVPLAALGVCLPVPSAVPLASQVALMSEPVQAAVSTVARESQSATMSWLFGFWVSGVVLFAGAQVSLQRVFVRRLGALQPTESGEWLSSRTDVGPMIIGVFPPRIVLPANFQGRYTTVEQELVLAHEHMHLTRRDPFTNFLMTSARALLWFHPLIHIAARCFRIDQELACDAMVVAAKPEALRRYARAILKTQLSDSDLPAECRWQSQGASLKRRLLMLKRGSPGFVQRLCGSTVIGVLLVASGGLAWSVQLPVGAAGESLVAAVAVQAAGQDVAYRLSLHASENGRAWADSSVIIKTGEPMVFSVNKAGVGGYDVSIVAHPAEQDPEHAVAVSMTVRKIMPDGGAIIAAEPTLVVSNREPAEIVVDDLVLAVAVTRAATYAPKADDAQSVNLKSLNDVLGGEKVQTEDLVLLVNGRRVSNSTASQLPNSILERIEVLPATVARDYDAGDKAGVINLILR
jgi:beta-lactamase regulating signal transducer with metallopeptidase domain